MLFQCSMRIGNVALKFPLCLKLFVVVKFISFFSRLDLFGKHYPSAFGFFLYSAVIFLWYNFGSISFFLILFLLLFGNFYYEKPVFPSSFLIFTVKIYSTVFVVIFCCCYVWSILIQKLLRILSILKNLKLIFLYIAKYSN